MTSWFRKKVKYISHRTITYFMKQTRAEKIRKSNVFTSETWKTKRNEKVELILCEFNTDLNTQLSGHDYRFSILRIAIVVQQIKALEKASLFKLIEYYTASLCSYIILSFLVYISVLNAFIFEIVVALNKIQTFWVLNYSILLIIST